MIKPRNFKNLTSERLMYFSGKIFTIESRAFDNRNKKLFQKCYRLNDIIFAELKHRGYV